MRRLPTPWLSEDTAPGRSASHAIGEPISRLNQLRPGGCTQLHHLNEAMPFRTAGRRPSSRSHRWAPTYLRRSHMPLCTAHKRLPLWWQNVCKCLDFAIAGIAANEWSGGTSLLLPFVATHCLDHLRTRPSTTRHQRHPIRPCPRHRRLFVRTSHYATKRIALIQTQMSNEKRVLELKPESNSFHFDRDI